MLRRASAARATRQRVDGRIRAEAAQLTQTVARGSTPDEESVAEVERLLRVRAVQSTVNASRWRNAILGLGGLLVVVLGMLLRRVGTVEVEGALRLSGIQLMLPDNPVLPVDEPLRSFSAVGFTRVEGIPSPPPPGGHTRGVLVEPLPGGTITFQQATLPPGARLRARLDTHGRASLQVDGGQGTGELLLALDGATRVILQQDTVVLQPGSATSLLLSIGPARFDASFVAVDSTLELLRSVDSDSLVFSEMQAVTDGSHSAVSVISTIESGELVLPGIGNEKVSLRAREHLTLRSPSIRVHRLRLGPRGIDVDFRARASELALGATDERRDLRPSYLEAYAANRPLELAETILISGIVMLAATLTWWRGAR
jgi:hypothetical protein